jgi:hypothetical protein
MHSRKIFHVTWNEQAELWNVLAEGLKRSEQYPSKSLAVAAARRKAKSYALGQIVIHKKDHEIEKEFTYGADPRDIPG